LALPLRLVATEGSAFATTSVKSTNFKAFLGGAMAFIARFMWRGPYERKDIAQYVFALAALHYILF
jgi:hypothetical protein